MNTSEVLVLNGPPGSGKSTLANEIAEQLRELGTAHAVIDVDELSRAYPEQERSFQWDNLHSVWSRYTTIPHIKVVLPVLIDTDEDLRQLREAVPTTRFTICELVAPESILKDRVTAREPNQYWQSKLRRLVDKYNQREEGEKFGDFQISTDNGSIADIAKRILQKVGWLV